MALTPGTRIGVYEIAAPIGEGGMGQVYRARDTKLDRDVAIKILPEAFAHDADRLARFQREAKTLASLNHPHIAGIYGLEESSGITALVMELVEGEDLSQRIARGAIPIDEALPIAKQIAEALEAAHGQGVVHRDIKPANVKVRTDGTVKVLDFGLAKIMDVSDQERTAHSDVLTNSPTFLSPGVMTGRGVILGTLAYMSPEQAAGTFLDKRTDLWSFGVVLMEMLTGIHVFPGETASHVLAAVLTKDPDWTRLPPTTPPLIQRLLRRCLEKDCKRRIADAADVRFDIEEAATSNATGMAPAAPRGNRMAAIATAVFLVVLSIASAAFVFWRSTDRTPLAPLYVSIDAPAGYVLGEDDALAQLPTHTPMLFMPDGHSVVIQAARAGKPQLFLRSLESPDAKLIVGTENARAPFLSPDGKWVGFWTANELRKVPIEGGPFTTICRLPAQGGLGPGGASWGPGDVIVFGDDNTGRINRVSAGGGTPVPVTDVPAQWHKHVTPLVLPDGRHILYSDVSFNDAADARLMVQALDGGDRRQLLTSATDARLLSSGRLAFMRLGTLMIVPFDPARAEIRGDAVAVMQHVMQSGLRGRSGAQNTGEGMFAISSLGVLSMIPGDVVGAGPNRLAWYTVDGHSTSAEPTAGSPVGGRLVARLSPDRSRAAVTVGTPLQRQLWLVDWSRSVWSLCGDCNVSRGVAVWSVDGHRMLVDRPGMLVAHSVDSSIADEVLVREPDRNLTPVSWLGDGRILYMSSKDVTGYEIKLLESESGAARTVLASGIGDQPAISPDGHWLAYSSWQTANVVVQAFPGPGARIQVSAGGGFDPAWSSDGHTLYYLKSDPGVGETVNAVDIRASETISAGTPRALFATPAPQGCTPYRCFDVADGPRFLFREPLNDQHRSVDRFQVVLNWAATLKP